MFYKRRKQKDAVTLAMMLQQQFDMDIDLESTESQYSWNSLTPYFVFFICLPLMIVSFSLSNKLYLPCAELFVISLVMTGLCFLGLSDSYDLLTLSALGSHAFASLPIFFAHLPQVPLITSILELVTQPFYSVYLGLNVSFNVSLPSIFYLLIPILFLCMAIRGSWSGIHKILIPHLVCYFWFSFSTVAFPFTSWTSLARATVGYMLLPLFIPFSFFIMLIGIPYTVYKLLQTEMIGKMIVTAVLLAVPIVLYQTKAFYGKKGEKTSPKELKLRKIIMVSFSALSILPLLFVRVPTILEKKSLTLTWEDFKDLCIPKGDLWAPYQIRCRDFLEYEVYWTGKVDQVKVAKVENTAENVIKALPRILSEPLYCIYGEKMADCDEQTMTGNAYRQCQLLKSAGQTCSLHSHNQVFFSVSIKKEEYILNIDAGPNFESGLLVLEPGDDVEFSGTLTNVGTPSPSLKLKSLNCTSRELNVEMKVDDLTGKTLLTILNDAIGLLFNFFLFPVLEYSTE